MNVSLYFQKKNMLCCFNPSVSAACFYSSNMVVSPCFTGTAHELIGLTPIFYKLQSLPPLILGITLLITIVISILEYNRPEQWTI
jgi:hypothetical protein